MRELAKLLSDDGQLDPRDFFRRRRASYDRYDRYGSDPDGYGGRGTQAGRAYDLLHGKASPLVSLWAEASPQARGRVQRLAPKMWTSQSAVETRAAIVSELLRLPADPSPDLVRLCAEVSRRSLYGSGVARVFAVHPQVLTKLLPHLQRADLLDMLQASPDQVDAVIALAVRFAHDWSNIYEEAPSRFTARLVAMTPAELAQVPEQLQALGGLQPRMGLLNALARVKEPWEPVVRNALALCDAVPDMFGFPQALVNVSAGRTPEQAAAFARACATLREGKPVRMAVEFPVRALAELPQAAWQPAAAAMQQVYTWHVDSNGSDWVRKMGDPAARASLANFDPATVADALSVNFMRRFIQGAPFPEHYNHGREEALCRSLRARMERQGTSAEAALTLVEEAVAAKVAPVKVLLLMLPAVSWADAAAQASPRLERLLAMLQAMPEEDRTYFHVDSVALLESCMETAPVPVALQVLEGLKAHGFHYSSQLNRLLEAIVAEPEPVPALQRLLTLTAGRYAFLDSGRSPLRRAFDAFQASARRVDPAACAALGVLLKAPVGDCRGSLASVLGALLKDKPDAPLAQAAPKLPGRALAKELVLHAVEAESQPRARASLEHRHYRDNVALRRAITAVMALAKKHPETARAALAWPQPAELQALLQHDLAEAAGDPARVAKLQVVLRAQSEFAARSQGDFVLDNRAYLREVRAYLATRVMPLQLQRLELTASLVAACPNLESTEPHRLEDLLVRVQESIFERFAAGNSEALKRSLSAWPQVENLLSYAAGKDGQTPAFTLFMNAVLQNTWQATRHAQSAQMRQLDPQQSKPWRVAWEAGSRLPIGELTPVASQDRLTGWHGADSAEPHHFLGSGLGGACVAVGKSNSHALMARALDASKRLLLLTNAAGDVQVRAMLRLMSDEEGKPVLMLSRCYNGGGIADETAQAAVLALAQTRARALGLPLAADRVAYAGAALWNGGSLTSEASVVTDYYDEGRMGLRERATVAARHLARLG